MKQKKIKQGLVFVTYRDYVRHFGVKRGAKKWKEAQGILKRVKDKTAPIVTTEIIEEVKEVEIEKTPLEKAEEEIEYRGREINKLIGTKGWYKYLKPEIELIIKEYKDKYDDVNNIVELRVNQKIREILQAILDFPKDCLEDAEVIRKEKKEKTENAINSGGEEGIKSND